MLVPTPNSLSKGEASAESNHCFCDRSASSLFFINAIDGGVRDDRARCAVGVEMCAGVAEYIMENLMERLHGDDE